MLLLGDMHDYENESRDLIRLLDFKSVGREFVLKVISNIFTEMLNVFVLVLVILYCPTLVVSINILTTHHNKCELV